MRGRSELQEVALSGSSRPPRVILHVSVCLCVLFLGSQVTWGQGAQGGGELTVALSSQSTETLEPALGGHIVKTLWSERLYHLQLYQSLSGRRWIPQFICSPCRRNDDGQHQDHFSSSA
jgi:hypothetical protein